MMSRQLTMFVESDAMAEVMATLTDDVLPTYCELPHFLGFTVVRSDIGLRTELVAMSYWDDGLEGSAKLSDEFVARIRGIDGVTASRRTFEILHASMRDTTGGFCSETK